MRITAVQPAMVITGPGGLEGRWSAVVGQGDRPRSGETDWNDWPYATTIFDFVRRAMPWQQPKTLTDNEVYALTAYVLALNKMIGENDVMNAETLPKVKCPTVTDLSVGTLTNIRAFPRSETSLPRRVYCRRSSSWPEASNRCELGRCRLRASKNDERRCDRGSMVPSS